MKQRVLVTGGTGYIGSHTVVELIERGFDVIIIDDLSNSTIEVLDAITKITGVKPQFERFDLCDNNKLMDFFTKHEGISSVIHFAAIKKVGESVQYPVKYYRNNLLSLMNLLEAMKNKSINNLVFSSSCTVYGEADQSPVTENTLLKPAISPYGNTKKIGEDMVRDATYSTGMNSISLRYFNPIGAHSSALIGELPSDEADNIMPAITEMAIGKRDEILVYGNTYDTPDGSCIRDYIHVVDIAKAHVAALDRLSKGENKSRHEVFNLGTGNGISVLEIIGTFEKVTGIKLNYSITEKRDGDIAEVYADTSYANNELGWKAEKSLEEMMSSAWEWEKALNRDKQ